MHRERVKLIVVLVGFVLLFGWGLNNSWAVSVRAEAFERVPPDIESPSGNTVVADCGGRYPKTQAILNLFQAQGGSVVWIEVTGARPKTLYTIWLRLRGTDADGNSFGGSPLTDGGSTPLAPSSELGHLLAATGEGAGSEDVANGFHTDDKGTGYFVTVLDFPILNGSYPFQTYPFSKRERRRLRLLFPESAIYPVAIVDRSVSSAPFTLRMVSHCTDGLGHGLTPGARETWFNWPALAPAN